MQIQDDIVKKILREHDELKQEYYDNLDCSTDGHVEIAQLATKLNSLSSSISSSLSDNILSSQSLINIFNTIEEYAVNLEDQNDKDQLEIMFFETILNTMSHFVSTEDRYRYIGLFKDNLGPASEELCEKNHQFWRDLIQKNREKYNR